MKPSRGDRPWRAREDETAKAYGALVEYLRCGPRRSLAKVAKTLGKRPGYVRQLEKWSTRNDWVSRAAAFDAAELESSLRGRGAAISKARQRLARALPRCCELLADYAEGRRGGITPTRLRAMIELLDRAGVSRVDYPEAAPQPSASDSGSTIQTDEEAALRYAELVGATRG